VLDRRIILGGVGALATASISGGATAQGQRPATLLPKTRSDNLMGFMRLYAGLEGSCVMTNEGLIYGKTENDLAKPLFGFLSVLEIRTSGVSAGVFKAEQKEAMVYINPENGGLLGDWTNTYTGETVVPVGYVSPNNTYFFDETGSYSRELPTIRSGTFKLDWRTSSSDIWVTESRFNTFPSSITEAEFPRAYSGPIRKSVDVLTFRAKGRDFADRRLGSVPSELTMMSDGPWPLWMMMGKRSGGVLWHGFGQKYRRLRDLPQALKGPIEAAYPGFLADPWGFPSAQWGTAAQLRRLRAQGKI
jgi:Protein of unknown function (DUF1838)